MRKRYSIIRLNTRRTTAHIYDARDGVILCGINKQQYTPFTLNKTQKNKEEMRQAFKKLSPRWSCANCAKKIK